jgi:hypothetical protein
MRQVILKNNINVNDYKEGDSYSKQYKVVDKKDHMLVIAKTFKNGKPKKSTQKFILAQ